MIYRAYKYRIYPNCKQQSQIRQICGCCRFVFNYFLSMRKNTYAEELLTVSYSQCSYELTSLKQYYSWLLDADSTALQSALKDLDEAYQHFFQGHNRYPRFKSKRKTVQSYTSKNNNNSIRMTERHIRLPKLGLVRTKASRPLGGAIINATVSYTSTGKYYVSVLCECPEPEVLTGGIPVGIDLGLRDFTVISDRLTHIENPEPLSKLQKRLAREQRSLSRKTKGSNRYRKQKRRIAACHEKVANYRRNFHHQLSTMLVRTYSLIAAEDLDVRQLLQDNLHTDSRRIADSGWDSFLRMLEYKSAWYGRKLIRVDRYFPSSQICHVCGHQNHEVKTKRLTYWNCSNCGSHHQRDENASINILNEGLRILQSSTM